MTENRFQRENYWKVVGVSVIGATIMTYFSCSSCAQDPGKFLLTDFFSSVMWSFMWIGNSELTRYTDRWISWVEFPVRRLIVGVVSTVLFTVLVAIGLLKSWEFAWRIKFASYNEFIFISLIITFLISLFMHGREFLLQWKQSAVSAERYQKESMTARYESLKNQVNPHFLFNSLNALTNLVYEDQDKAVKFIKQLSEVYRYVLDTREKELVTLQEELAFVQSYLFLQQIRFGNNLKVNVNLNNTQGKVAPLALQILFENAIKHNVISTDNPLSIEAYEVNGFICVINNLQLKSKISEEGTGLGLENIKSRYKFLTHKEVDVSDANGKFSVKLPIIELQEA
jgi:sensor histidine kinase YesM